MLDGVPTHFSLIARKCLNYPGRWIGRGGPVAHGQPEVLNVIRLNFIYGITSKALFIGLQLKQQKHYGNVLNRVFKVLETPQEYWNEYGYLLVCEDVRYIIVESHFEHFI